MTASHCSIQPPQQLRHTPVELHALGIEPKPFPVAVPLLRRRRRARAHRGPANPEGDRARELPQELPHALEVLVRTTFLYPEPSFAYNTGDPNFTSAIDAGELVSGHLALERRPG